MIDMEDKIEKIEDDMRMKRGGKLRVLLKNEKEDGEDDEDELGLKIRKREGEKSGMGDERNLKKYREGEEREDSEKKLIKLMKKGNSEGKDDIGEIGNMEIEEKIE